MLRLLTNRRVLGSAVVVAGLIAVVSWPTTIQVDVASVSRGSLVVTVDEEGVTRVRDRFIVSAPVSGRVVRIELEPGDRVKRGQVVARVRPEAPPLLDARTRAEAEAVVESARAALGRARAEEQRTKATLEQARRDLARVRPLADERVIAKEELEAHEVEVHVAEETAKAAAFAVRAATSELQRAEARLAPSKLEAPDRMVNVTAPVEGVVLKRVRESESVVPAGDPLLEIGDPGSLEIVADLLSTDAVRAKAGARAIVEQWGGEKPLEARVRRIEPAGFMKILSARRRGAARERGARLCRVFTGRAGVVGRRLSSRGPCRHLGVAKCAEGVDERVVSPWGEMGRVRDGRRPCAADCRRVRTPDGSVRGSDIRARRRRTRGSPSRRYACRRRSRA